ncbi:MAG: tetratricopeptide repeat protein [Cyclobacteriaceae bacterium]|jgi:tetratricopeptide (TPR) repeat protein|nr:tetratricopeptide repeat protein [Cyclobacteriaceae bacterium]
MKVLLLSLVMVFYFSANYGQSLADSLQTALPNAEGEKKVKLLNRLFGAYVNNEPVKALGFAREALNLAITVNDKKGMAAAYNNLGVAYRNQGALDKALEYYLKAQALYEQIEDNTGIASVKNNMATIYALKKDYGLALNFMEQSHGLLLQQGNKERIVGSMNNLGNLNSELNRLQVALKYYSEAAQLAEQSGIVYPDPVENLGNLYLKQGNYTQAITYFTQALALQQKTNNQLGKLNTLVNLATAYLRSGNTKSAEKTLQEAVILSNSLEAFTNLPAVYKTQAEIYYQQGQHKKAYEVYQRYDSLREKIYGEESSRKIAQMQLVVNFSEKEKEFQMLQKESEIQELELRNIRLVVVLAVLAVFSVIAVISLFYRKKLIK